MFRQALARGFGYTNANPRRLQKQIQEATLKIRHRRTAADAGQMREFVRESAQSGRMGSLINKTARLDAQFDQFMNELDKKNEFQQQFDAAELKREQPFNARERPSDA